MVLYLRIATVPNTTSSAHTHETPLAVVIGVEARLRLSAQNLGCHNINKGVHTHHSIWARVRVKVKVRVRVR